DFSLTGVEVDEFRVQEPVPVAIREALRKPGFDITCGFRRQLRTYLGAARAGAHLTHPHVEAVEPLVGNVDRLEAFPGAIRRFTQLRFLGGGALGETGLRRGQLLGELALRRTDLALYKGLRRAAGAEHGDTAAEDQGSQSSRHDRSPSSRVADVNRRRSCANVHAELRSPSGRRTLRPCAGTMVHPFSRRWASVRSRRRASISQAGQPVLVTEGDGNLLRPWHFAASLRTRPEDFYEVFTRIGSGKIPQSPFPNSTMRFRHSTPELTRLLPPPGPVKR